MQDPAPPSQASALPVAVELQRVSKLFGSFVVLRDTSLALPPGASAVLLGPNGAGKSTLLKLVAGLAQPTYGQVRVLGGRPDQARGRIAYMGHSTMLYDELTGAENLRYFLALDRPGLKDAAHADTVAHALQGVGLDPANPRRVGEYSQGMRQRAALARVLMSGPELLLLDEPFSNLDTASAQAMVSGLRRFLASALPPGQTRTLLLTTHQQELARPLAGLTLHLEAGRLEVLPADLPSVEPAPIR